MKIDGMSFGLGLVAAGFVFGSFNCVLVGMIFVAFL